MSVRPFSVVDPNEFEITPLGAAIVEALPNRKKVNRIKRAFRERGVCPASDIFSEEQVAAWAKAAKK